MNTSNIKSIVLVTSMAWNLSAIAAPISRSDYQSSHDRINAEYASAKEGCSSMSGNARDICTVQANGQNKIALAELEASYQPSAKSRVQVRSVKAEAEYAVAIQRCEGFAGNAKDVCVKDAKSAEIAAKANSKVKKIGKEARGANGERGGEERV